MIPRVELEELSRLMDGEVTAAERADIEARLVACPLSAALLARLQCLNQAIAGATFRRGVQPATETASEAECLSDTTILAVANDTLPEAEISLAETHLVSCLACLARVLEALRTTMSLHADRWPALPEEVRKVIALTPTPSPSPAGKRPAAPEVWHRLSLSLEASSAERVNRVFMTGHLTVKLVARVMMSREMDANAKKCLHVECFFHAGTQPHAGQVLIAIDATTRRPVSTARADDAGRLSLPPLTLGRYHLSVQNTSLRIELSVMA